MSKAVDEAHFLFGQDPQTKILNLKGERWTTSTAHYDVTLRAFAAASAVRSVAMASDAAVGCGLASSASPASRGTSGRLAMGVSAGSEHTMLQMLVTSLRNVDKE